jgi:two-component system response regulator HydG
MPRILLVEDDLDVRVLLEHVLQSAGLDVIAVETVANAIKLVETRPFDLVVTDGKLGDGIGIDIADAAKARGIESLIVTGHAFQLPQARLSQYDYLLKPIRPAELLDAIRRKLPRRDGAAEIVPFPKSS